LLSLGLRRPPGCAARRAYTLPRPPSWIKGRTREERRDGKRGSGKGGEEEGEGKEGKKKGSGCLNPYCEILRAFLALKIKYIL